MKKSIFLFFAAILCATSAWAWCGNSFITVNGTWCIGSNSYVHDGGKFHGKDLGTLTTLELGGEFQVWPSSTTAGTLCYKIDDGTENSISLPKTGTDGNNSKHSGSGAVDLSGLAGGSHSIAVWFKHGSDIDNNDGSNFVATFTITAAPEPDPTPDPAETETVYFVNAEDWDGTINVYAWTDSPKVENAGWPGAAATKEANQIAGHDVYSFTAEKGKFAKVIFNNNNGKQTGDLAWTAGQYICKNEWCADEAAVLAKLTGPVEYESVYFINVKNWTAVNIYTWNPGIGTWPGKAMTKEENQIAGYDVYSYTVEKGTTFGGMKFNEGDGKRETGDLTWATGKYYVVDLGWLTKEEAETKLAAPLPETWNIVGAAGLMGKDWDLNAAENAMTQQADGTYLLEKKDITITAGTYEYKAAKDHGWNVSVPAGADNQKLTISKSGIYDITFVLDVTAKKLTATATLKKEAVVIPTVIIAGDMNNWDQNKDKFTMAADSLTATFKATLTAKSYAFKMIVGGAWLSDGKTITRANNSTVFTGANSNNNTKITADIAGEYTFTWTYETKTLTVSYPVLPIYTVTVTAENGTVEGLAADGKYEHGTKATLTATPAEGYEFVNWTVGGKEVSAKNPYTFTVTADVALVANFAKKVYTVTIAAENGTVEGLAADGKYEHGAEATLTATPAEGYQFVNWTKGEEVVSTVNPYKFTVTADVDLVANFAKKVYTVTVAAENGTVEGLAADGKYEHGAEATLTATAAEGYEFTCWTSGKDTVSTENPYKFTVTADIALVANFKEAATEIVLENAYKEVYSMLNRANFFGEHATYGDISVQVNNYNGYGTYAEGVSSRIDGEKVNGSATFENKGETDLLTATLTDAEGTVYIVKAEVAAPKTYNVVATEAQYTKAETWAVTYTVTGLSVDKENYTLTIYAMEEGNEASMGEEGAIQGLVELAEVEGVLTVTGTLKDAAENKYVLNFTATPKAAETYTLTFEDMVIEPDQWSKNLNISAENEDYAIEFFLFDGQTKGYGEYGFTEDGYPDVDDIYLNDEYVTMAEGTVANYYLNEETGLATIELTVILGIDIYNITLTGEPLVNPEDIVPTDTINITMTEGTIGLVYSMVKVAASSEEADLSIVLVGGDPYAGVTTKDFAAASYLVTTAGSLTFLRGGLEIVEVGDVKIAYIGVLCSDHKWYNIVLTTGTEAPTALDNLNTTVAPVKMIENGQLIIVKDGVQYNAQGAILK